MENLTKIKEILTAAWSFLKKYNAGSASEERRCEAFREINDLMTKLGTNKKTPIGEYTYDVLRASYDLIDELYLSGSSNTSSTDTPK